MERVTLLDLTTFSDPRGSLTVLDKVLPFPIVRTYWIYDADNQTRGGHRHHVTRQALIAVTGTVTVFMNDGVKQADIVLSKPSQCLLVEPKDWHTMTFGPRAVLLVISSHHYDRNDYIDARYE
jgi:dTDP-4-dehydrorhamnose 3,5-epimerase-like enzyme